MALITWNTSQVSSSMILSNDNMTANITGGSNGFTSNSPTNKIGKKYFEFKNETSSATYLGIKLADTNNINDVSSTYLYYSNGVFQKDGVATSSTGETFASNDIISIMVDFDEFTISFRKNNIIQAIFTDERLKDVGFYAHFRRGGGSPKVTVNFGSTEFTYPLPDGYEPYDKANAKWLIKNKILLLSDNKIYSLKSEEIIHEIKMTSNSSPAPYFASASTTSSTNFEPYKAFNGTTNGSNDAWQANVNEANPYITIDFGSSKKVNFLEVKSRNSGSNFPPKAFNILGSNDGSNFYEIGSISNQINWELSESRLFYIKYGNYRFYRLYTEEKNTSVVSIGEIVYGYKDTLINQLPTLNNDDFVKYGASYIGVDGIFTNKNYILQDNVSENADGLWVQEINRKPLSIKFE